MYSFPLGRPDLPESASALWSLQNHLLNQAERLLGSRDLSKKIYRPSFHQDGPILINTASKDGAFVALSQNAAGYWPTVVYEMAHETIHLLDPTVGYTTWIEEGTAVLFAEKMSSELTNHPMTAAPLSPYAAAASLVGMLPNPLFESIRSVCQLAHKLSVVTRDHLKTLFPLISGHLADQLSATCIPR